MPVPSAFPGLFHPHAHVVQLEEDGERLAGSVARYVDDGLKRGASVLIVADAAHRAAFARHLALRGTDVVAAVRAQHVIFWDAATILERIMLGGMPDSGRFELIVGSAVRELYWQPGKGAVRVYGEMVGLLWAQGEHAAALRLEQLWNELLRSVDFTLYCAYPIDLFGDDFQIAALDGLLCSHTHVVPAAPDGALERAIDRSMDEVLGARVSGLRRLMKPNYRPAWAALPKAESTILWLRNNLPQQAGEILTRARRYYQAASA